MERRTHRPPRRRGRRKPAPGDRQCLRDRHSRYEAHLPMGRLVHILHRQEHEPVPAPHRAQEKRVERARDHEQSFWPRRQFGAALGAHVAWYSRRGPQNPQNTEAELIEAFYYTFGPIPSANATWPGPIRPKQGGENEWRTQSRHEHEYPPADRELSRLRYRGRPRWRRFARDLARPHRRLRAPLRAIRQDVRSAVSTAESALLRGNERAGASGYSWKVGAG